jgi:hypothetical protein
VILRRAIPTFDQSPAVTPGFCFPINGAKSEAAKKLIQFRTHQEQAGGQHQKTERAVRNEPFIAAAKAGGEKSFQPRGCCGNYDEKSDSCRDDGNLNQARPIFNRQDQRKA